MSDDSSKSTLQKESTQKVASGVSKTETSKITHTLILAVVTILIFIGTQLLAGLLVGLFGAGRGMSSNEISDWLLNSTYAEFGYIVLAEALVVGAVMLIARSRHRKLSDYGLGRPKLSDAFRAILVFFAFYAALIAANVLIKKFVPAINSDQKQDIGFENVKTHLEILATFISLVMLPPIAEEVLIRGFFFSSLRRRLSFISTAIITSIIFGAAHLEPGSGNPLLWAAAIDTFILALALSYLREKTGTIWAGVGVHSLNNLVAFLVLYASSFKW